MQSGIPYPSHTLSLRIKKKRLFVKGGGGHSTLHLSQIQIFYNMGNFLSPHSGVWIYGLFFHISSQTCPLLRSKPSPNQILPFLYAEIIPCCF